MKSVSLATVVLLAMIANTAAHAGGCAADISTYRRAHGLSAVRADAALDRIARQQAAAMARSETVSHTVDGNFFVRIKPVHRRLAAENVAAGFLTCAETIKQWDASSGHRDNLRMVGARRVGVASVAKPSSRYRRFWAMVITD
ncbi:MAG: CAP domain-containing protein [Nitrobacter sp.]